MDEKDQAQEVAKIVLHLKQPMPIGTDTYFYHANTASKSTHNTTYLAELNRMASLMSDESDENGLNQAVIKAIDGILKTEHAASVDSILTADPKATFDLLANKITSAGNRWAKETFGKNPPKGRSA